MLSDYIIKYLIKRLIEHLLLARIVREVIAQVEVILICEGLLCLVNRYRKDRKLSKMGRKYGHKV